MSATEAAAKAFFSYPAFAVVGASSNPAKYGNKSTSSSPSHPLPSAHSPPNSPPASCQPEHILTNRPVLKWYHNHNLPVTPINPTSATITLPSVPTPLPALPSIAQLPTPKTTSLSIITPPGVTLSVLREAKGLGIPAVWLQPGSFDDEVVKFLGEAGFESSVLGKGGAGSEGWCVLVDGERALKGAGKL